jgi:hypothetical protein
VTCFASLALLAQLRCCRARLILNVYCFPKAVEILFRCVNLLLRAKLAATVTKLLVLFQLSDLLLFVIMLRQAAFRFGAVIFAACRRDCWVPPT